MLQGLINWLAKFHNLTYNAQISIDYAHNEIHEGEHYNVGHLSTGVANDGNLDIRFKTGASEVHAIIQPISSGKSYFNVYEGATISDGTAITAYNNSRSSTNTTLCTITRTPTVTSTGTTVIFSLLIPGGTGGNATGNTGAFRNEFILKANTEYLIRLTNKAGTTQDLNTIISYYEH